MSRVTNEKKIKNTLYAKHVTNTGECLYNLRTKAGLSQQELVDQLVSQRKGSAFVKISKTQYIRLEHGKSFMNTETLMALCKFYGVSSDYILFGEKPAEDSIANFLSKNNAVAFCNLLEYIIKQIQKNII